MDAEFTLKIPQGYAHPMALVESRQVGEGTRIWAFAHVMAGASVGKWCNICEGCFLEDGVSVGDHVTLKNGVAVWTGVHIADNVFIGPNAVFTNDLRPRAWIKPPQFQETWIERGASIGANTTIICGVRLGEFCMIGAGSVVTRDIRPFELVTGNPARHKAWICFCGRKFQRDDVSCSCGGEFSWNDEGEPRPDSIEPVPHT